jgi:sialic acid synthase SpsE
MRRLEGETYADWVERVRLFEKGYALQRVAKGDDHETIVEEMSIRMMDKLMNPVYKAIRDSKVTNFDAEKSRQAYYDKYLSKHKPKSDHVLDD